VNLEFIEKARADGSEVHVVTQLANSLLGLILFLWEKTFVDHMKDLQLEKLAKEGWPKIEMVKGTGETLYDFAHHLRNAVAHGRVTFSSDSHDPQQVTVQIDDCGPREHIPYWTARMRASELRSFWTKFFALLENTIVTGGYRTFFF
jgi:hypothetical protein